MRAVRNAIDGGMNVQSTNRLPDRLLYLSKSDVESVGLSMKEIIVRVEDAFREKGYGRVEMPPKPGIHPLPDAFIHAMPALIPSMRAAGMKWVSGFPENHEKGLPYISGLLVLNDPDTGLPIMVSDCTWITAMRTGAASAVAAKYLARGDSDVMAVIGCGVQGRSNLLAMRSMFPGLAKVHAYDIRPEATYTYRAWALATFDRLEVSVSPTAEHAVRQADIIITSGPILKNPSPVIRSEWFKEGGFSCPVDFDSYWTGEALEKCDLFLTDDVEQLLYYRRLGYFQRLPEIYADFGEIVAGKKLGRTSPKQRIIAMNLGIALEDMAVAVLLHERAREKGIGTWLQL